MKKLIAAILAAILLCSCELPDVASNKTEEEKTEVSTSATPAIVTSESDTTSEPESEPEPEPLPVYSEMEIGETKYDPCEYFKLCEAEDGVMTGYANVSSKKEGYSGRGYVSGVSLPDSALVIEADLPSAQHYAVTVCASSDSPVTGILYVDGLAKAELKLSGSGSFEAIKYDNIYLASGDTSVSIGSLSGECDIDFVIIENSDNIYNHDYSVSGQLVNKNASEKTVKLYKYLCEMYGEAILTAQQCEQGSSRETEAVARHTGRYPAIRFGELMGYSEGIDTKDIELAIDYAEKGGLVGYSWYWMQNGSCYSERSGFSLENAVTDHGIALLSPEKIEELASSGGISKECASLINGIDLVAAELKRLQSENIPLIFRPLPEAGNGMYWWGESIDGYKWLYKLIFTRMSGYHQLNNIIWVWNGQDVDWYVGDDLCDIVSLDIYDLSHAEWNNQSHITPMLRLYDAAPDKPAAISECNVLPGLAGVVKDKSFWLYASVSDSFALDTDGYLATDHISDAEWIMFYNCVETVTLDELIEIK